MQSKHYMRKGDGPIVKVNLNEWAKYRKMGYDFSTELDYNRQQQGDAPAPVDAPTDDVEEVPTMENTKAEIMAYVEANDIDADDTFTKSELLDAIDDAA